jgi:AcrR family transcriptional regulator
MDRPSGQETRGRLLDAAAELVAELGWGRVTTRTVAERAGLPHGAVSYHFAGKQALLAEAALALIERSFPLEAVRGAEGLTGLVSLMRSWADATSPVDRVGAEVLMEAMREAGRDPGVRDRLVGLLTDYRQAVADLVRADQRSGVLAAHVDPDGLAALLCAAGDGLLLHAMLDPNVDRAGAVGALSVLLAPAGGQTGSEHAAAGRRRRS